MLTVVVAIFVVVVVIVAIAAVVLTMKSNGAGSVSTSVPRTQRSASEGTTPKAQLPDVGQSLLPLLPLLPVLPQPTDDQLDHELDHERDGEGDERIVVSSVGITDVGLKRKHNEDAFVCMPDHQVYALADGMGAHTAGEVASKLTLEAISDAFERNKFLNSEDPDRPSNRRKRVANVVHRANQIVFSMAKEIEGYRGMGSTMVMVNLSVRKNLIFIAHVGDSRCYRIRGGNIKQLTVDHTLGNVGIMGRTSSILSRAVGIEASVEAEINVHKTAVGDVYVLCSDGLSRMISDEDIGETVQERRQLDKVAEELIAKAKLAGGKDNITTVLIRLDPPEPAL